MRSDILGNRDLPVSSTDLCGVTGHRVPLKGPTEVELEIGKTSVCFSVFVADIEDPCILGLDFLNSYNCRLDLPNLSMDLNELHVPLRMHRDEETVLYASSG